MTSRRRGIGDLPALVIRLGAWVSVIAAVAAACVRDPLPTICPAIEPGALVITEIRGPQSEADTYGQWIEIYNASDAAIDLAGIAVRAVKSDGSGDFEFLIRDADLTLSAGAYAVLGGAGAGDKPFVDYDYAGEEGRDLYSAGFLRIYSCDVLVEAVLVRGLPGLGTLALDGAAPPDAATNDDTADPIWCVDAAPPGPGEPMTELGLRGTPGEANRPCMEAP